MTLNNFLKETIRALSIVILFLPLFVSKNTFYPYIFGKIIFFQVIVEIIFFLWLILLISEKNLPNFKNPFILSLTIFLGILIFTAFTGEDIMRSFFSTSERMTGVFTIIHLYLWFLVLISLFKDFSDWKKFIFSSIFVSFFVGLYAIFQQFNFKFVIPNPDLRFSSTLGNPIYLSVYAMLHIFFAIFLFSIEKNKFLKSLLILFALFNLYIMILGASKGAFFAFFLSSLFLLITLIVFSPSKKIRFGLLVVLLAILLSLGFVLKEKEKILTLKIPFGIKRVLSEIKIDDARKWSWEIAVKGFKEKPILGWGWENYNIIFNKYYNPKFQEYFHIETTWYDKSHNQILDILCQTGIFGGIVYLLFFFFAFSGLFQKAKEDLFPCLILASYLFAYFVQNLFVFDTPSSLIVFYFSLALIYFYVFPQPKREEINKRKKTNKEGWVFVFIPFVAIFLSFLIYEFNFYPYQMSKLGAQGSKIFKKDPSLGFLYFQKSLKKSSLYAPEIRSVLLKNFLENFQSFPPEKEGLKKEIFAFAVSEAKKSIEEHPKDVKYYIFLNKLYREGNLLKEAEEILKKALELSPTRQEIYYDLGQIKIFQKDFEAGANYYRKAVELAPEIADSHFYYGLSLIIDQKNEEGIKEIEKAYEMGKGIESENADALSVISAGYFGIKNYEKSLYFSELALKKDPHLLSALYLKTVSLFGLGEKEKAEETLKQIEAINKELAQKIRGSL